LAYGVLSSLATLSWFIHFTCVLLLHYLGKQVKYIILA